MADDKTQVYLSRIRQLLRHAHGRRNALTLDRITKLCEIPSRRATEAILEHHLEDLGYCVVSGDKGYWRPLTAEEINHYRRSLRSRLVKLVRRDKAVKRMASHDGFVRTGKNFQDPPEVQGELFTKTQGETS